MMSSFVQLALKNYGLHALSYATLQPHCQYFSFKDGYLAYFQLSNLVCVLGDPVADKADWPALISSFLTTFDQVSFYYISARFACFLRQQGLYITPFGQEHRLMLNKWTLSWNKTPYLKRQLSKARSIRVIEGRRLDVLDSDLRFIDEEWLKHRGGITHKHIFLTRPLSYIDEVDVRFFLAYQGKQLVAYRLFDPMYRDGSIYGYYASICRYLPHCCSGVATTLLVSAFSSFKSEGLFTVSLGLSPFEHLSLWRGLPLLNPFFISFFYLGYPLSFRGLATYKNHFRAQKIWRYMAFSSVFPVGTLWKTKRMMLSD
ncbi:MAG: DUF2156 domain-containing protein [bacterium]